MVSGYVGEVVARVHIDQDLTMDQDVDISFLIDGDGHFALLLDQDMRIDQEVEIDIEIFDVDGVLYVDLFLRDSIEIEQDTTLDVRISDGSPGGTVEVNQDIELDQTVDIDIDVEDELEERYVVKVDVASLQEVDARPGSRRRHHELEWRNRHGYRRRANGGRRAAYYRAGRFQPCLVIARVSFPRNILTSLRNSSADIAILNKIRAFLTILATKHRLARVNSFRWYRACGSEGE